MWTANIFISRRVKVAVDAIGIAIFRILGITPEVTNKLIFKQEQIKRAVELVVRITSPNKIEFVTNSKEAETLIIQIKENFIGY